MKVFMTGATGYIGSVVVEKLLAAGHSVVGLVRSDESAAKLARTGAEPLVGLLTETAKLGEAARQADGVIHTAFDNAPESVKIESEALAAMTAAIAGSGKPFVYTSAAGVTGNTGDQIVDETTPLPAEDTGYAWRIDHENQVFGTPGIRGAAVRVPLVYGRGGSFIVPFLLQAARRDGFVGYIGDGHYRNSTVHVDDLAELFRLALEKSSAGQAYYGAADLISMRELVEAVAKNVGITTPPQSWTYEEALQHVNYVAHYLQMDLQVSGDKARRELGWQPSAPSVIAEIEQGSYLAK